jgi:hypothetical protein
MFFFLTCTFWLQLCKMQTLHRDDRASLARNQHIQLVDSLGQQLAMYSFGSAGMNLQLFSLNFWITGCVILAYLVEFHAITKILLTLREITKKITKNFQLPKKSEESRNITKVIKITKSGHTGCYGFHGVSRPRNTPSFRINYSVILVLNSVKFIFFSARNFCQK